MDWAQIIVVLLSIILGILVVIAIGLVVAFVLVTHKIRQASSDVRTLMQSALKLVSVARTVVSAVGGIKAMAKVIKQKKEASGGRRNQDS